WQLIVSSSLLRCREFAEEMAQRHGLPLVIEHRLIEIGFGAWEGRTAAEILLSEPDAIARFWRDPLLHTPPGAERLDDFSRRVTAAWQSVLARFSGQHILLVGHAGVIRMILRQVLDFPLARVFSIEVPYAGITRVQTDGKDAHALPRLIFHAGAL
ncbi:MAG: histidine phosphatase family protein, partial [Pseudomonadota bacterium]